MPALPHLKLLELRNLGLQSFPDCLASALNQLTSLDLSHQDLQKIQPALSQITALQTLDLSFNNGLQLEERGVEILAALLHLQSLHLSKQSHCDESKDAKLSQRSVRFLFAIKARLPDLNLHGFA